MSKTAHYVELYREILLSYRWDLLQKDKRSKAYKEAWNFIFSRELERSMEEYNLSHMASEIRNFIVESMVKYGRF